MQTDERRERAIEAAARHSYIYEGDRKGCSYIGWEREPEDIKQEWRESVVAVVDAYEAALKDAGYVMVPVEPTKEMCVAMLNQENFTVARAFKWYSRAEDFWSVMLSARPGGDTQ